AGAEALHARTARAAEQEGAAAGIVARLALGEGLLPEKVETVVQPGPLGIVEHARRRWPLAAVEPPALDAELDEVAVLLPPPGADSQIGEIEKALPFVEIVGGTGAWHDPLVAVVEQEPA